MRCIEKQMVKKKNHHYRVFRLHFTIELPECYIIIATFLLRI